jgi:Tol biopolymer transport system component/predicted Ser/Thr protein kinase
MSLAPGTRIGPYEVVSMIGAGGMGEVYRARDTRLDRTVAIKILPSTIASDPAYRARFEREAKAVAALSHPHICPLFDVGHQNGTDFLVMEFLEGETLAARLRRGRLPIDQAIRCAIEIADALDKAHRQGIVHRDLKPGNVMLTKAGVKLLDFGLAKLHKPVTTAEGDATTPAPERVTAEGTILGTLHYMAPEQLEGRNADGRTDIWAFGCMLHEMLTGERPFDGNSSANVMASILTGHPAPVTSLQPAAPAALDHVVTRCLNKDPEDRWQTARDLGAQLKWLTTPVIASAQRLRMGRVRDRALLVGALILAVALTGVTTVWFQASRPRPESPLRKWTIAADTRVGEAVISPDGRRVAYTSGRELWVQDLDRDEPRKLAEEDGIGGLCWSPRSDFVVFAKWTVVLKKVSVQGGPIVTLWELPGGSAQRPNWSLEGRSVVFANGFPARLYEVPADGGEARLLFQVNASESRYTFQDPHFLPHRGVGRRLLLVTGFPENTQIAALDLESGRREILGPGQRPVYSSTGHIVYETAGDLWAMPFSVSDLKRSGEPFPIQRGASHPSIAADGTLVSLGTTGGLEQLIWRDRRGVKLGPVGQPQRRVRAPRLSPDGRRILAQGWDDTPQLDIWIHDVTRGSKTRLTSHPASEQRGAWTPHGNMITFTSERNGTADIFIQSADGSREPKALVATSANDFGSDWSDDGKYLIYNTCSRGQCDLWYLKRKDGYQDFEASPFIQSPFDEYDADFSPDGRFVAYTANDSGRNEVYVRRFPDGTDMKQISMRGGAQPRWRKDGKELFYVDDTTLVAVRVAFVPKFEPGAAERLFEDKEVFPGRGMSYDVSFDGQRILMREVLEKANLSIRVVQNWFAEFRNRQ